MKGFPSFSSVYFDEEKQQQKKKKQVFGYYVVDDLVVLYWILVAECTAPIAIALSAYGRRRSYSLFKPFIFFCLCAGWLLLLYVLFFPLALLC